MSKQVDRSLDDGSVVMSEAGIRNSERLEGAKMKIVQLPRNVPPRITDNDVLRRTDECASGTGRILDGTDRGACAIGVDRYLCDRVDNGGSIRWCAEDDRGRRLGSRQNGTIFSFYLQLYYFRDSISR